MTALLHTRRARLAMSGVAAMAAVAAVSGTSAGAAPGARGHAALHVASSETVPGATAKDDVVSAEASNGDVAIAVSATSASDEIELMRIGHAPKALITVPPGTVALAFGDNRLFIAGEHAVSAVNRHSGALLRTWVVKATNFGPDGHTMAYGGGRLWLLGSTGHGRKVLEINPSAAAVKTIASGHNVVAVAAGAQGGYFVEGGGHTLVRVLPGGHQITAPTHETVNETLSGPTAVHVTAVDGGELLVAHDAGQGFDSDIIRYNAKTLAHLSDAGTDVAHSQVVPTRAGPLVLLVGSDEGCPGHAACVDVISTTSAATSHQVHLPKGLPNSVLLGPHPAVVVGHSGHDDLIRLQ